MGRFYILFGGVHYLGGLMVAALSLRDYAYSYDGAAAMSGVLTGLLMGVMGSVFLIGGELMRRGAPRG